MKPTAAARLAWSVWAVTLALLAAALALGAVNGSVRLGHVALAVAFLCFPTVGALIVSRRPGNAVGWICCAIGPGVALAVAPLEYVTYAVAHPGSLPAPAWVGWPAAWTWYGVVALKRLEDLTVAFGSQPSWVTSDAAVVNSYLNHAAYSNADNLGWLGWFGGVRVVRAGRWSPPGAADGRWLGGLDDHDRVGRGMVGRARSDAWRA